MPWYRVDVANSGAEATKSFATRLADEVGTALRAAGFPSAARMYHAEFPSGDHVYVLSPEAASIVSDVIERYHGKPLEGEPLLEGLKPVVF